MAIEEKTAEATESIKTMKGIYLEKDIKKDDKEVKSIAYFIGSFKEDDEEFVEIDDNAAIAKSAFAHSNVEKILFKGEECSDIGEKAFEDCGELTTVIFGKPKTDKPETDKTLDKSILKNLKHTTVNGNFTIQANAFNGCGSLTTLVLPEVKGTLTIEKDAFCGCDSLRTVVAICNKIDFTDNPFPEQGDYLTFICKKDSGVARFARENGYRSVYVG